MKGDIGEIFKEPVLCTFCGSDDLKDRMFVWIQGGTWEGDKSFEVDVPGKLMECGSCGRMFATVNEDAMIDDDED